MIIPNRIRWSLIGAAMVLLASAAAADPCPPTPERYRDQEFGDARFAIEEGCECAFTQDERFFVAGIAQKLMTGCKLPKDRKAREKVDRFVKATTLAVAYPDPDKPILDGLAAQRQGTAAFAAGMEVMEDIRCRGPEAALLARGIVLYLERSSKDSRFVVGCVEFYGGRYTEKQCQCIAENLRAVLPDVNERFFDRDIIKATIDHSPFIALPLMISCGLWNY